MEIKTETVTSSPPRVISSIVAGFNSVARNIYVIIFPITLDILLWFGPRLRLRNLFEPLITELNSSLSQMNSLDMKGIIAESQEIWQIIFTHFNLLSVLRTFPIGVPSLISSQGFLKNPLGVAPIFEVTSFRNAIIYFLSFIILGILFANLYFSEVARFCNHEVQNFSLKVISWQFPQTLILTPAIYLILLILLFPISILVTTIAFFNGPIAQIVLFAMSFFLLWLLLPLIFSPHGIFANQQNALASILTSVRLVRFFLPGTGLFLLIILLINQGLDVIWQIPPETSWMTLVGIFGHAFISTSLLASSFIYYRDGVQWMQQNIKRHSTHEDKH